VSLLLGCPFCSEIPSIYRWHGGGPQKTVAACSNERCPVKPSVCGPTRAKAIKAWNMRKNPQVTSAELVPFTRP
jgi:hypothetical protein